MDSDDVLNLYLSAIRLSAGLSVEDVCLRTKIQPRFVEALEAGRWGEVPSNTHLRAFSVALARACGGDEARTVELVRAALAATAPAPAGPAGRGFDTPPPPPALAVPSGRGADAAAPEGFAPMARTGPAERASRRLRSLPVPALLSALALVGTLSYGAARSVEHWRRLQMAALLGSGAVRGSALPGPVSAPSAPPPVPAVDAPWPAAAYLPLRLQKGLPDILAESAAPSAVPGAPQAQTGTAELALRARRACWLVLEIDGQRLPTVTMADGDKRRWPVSREAVLLAGNLGALRVWWRGDNEGYLGDLGQRANAVVFERGRKPRLDPSAALPLPVGIE